MEINLYAAPEKRLNTGMIGGRTSSEYKTARTGIPSEVGVPTLEDRLVAVGKTKSRQDFIALFNHFAPRIKSYMMKGGMAQDAADELAQEAMLTLWRKADLYDPAKAAASTWVFTIARNLRIDALRRNQGLKNTATLDDLPMLAAPDAPVDAALDHTRETIALEESLAKLPSEQADIIRKAFFEEKTHSAIAQDTGLPLGTVKSRIRLALERLRTHMKGTE